MLPTEETPQLGQLPPGSPAPEHADDGDQEVLGEELRASHHHEEESDREDNPGDR
jgi:hypothetical protein